MPSVDLPLSTVDYRVFGPDKPRESGGPTVVFVHGFLVNGTLWDPVAERLAAAGIRSIVPDWPLGSHRTPVPAEAILSPRTVGRAVLDLLDVLDLRDVVLVGNDTGGAICQLALTGDHDRVGGLVLTNCDAFETFPPKFFVPLFVAARFRWAVWGVLQTTRLRLLRHSLAAFGPLLRRPRSSELTRGWVQPALDDAAIRHDITRFARELKGDELVHAASWLASFDRPTRIVWGTRDRNFTLELGRRLAATLPLAELVEDEGATTFVSIDRPDTVTAAISSVIADLRPGLAHDHES
jgi:pimeloyl-ACP methyl ester carboxylesterase